MRDTRASDAMQPLVFAILKGLTHPDIQVVLYDERLEKIPDNIEADLVAMTVETFTARRAYMIADGLRKRKIPVVMGGYHPTFMPEEALLHCDAVVTGDAEKVWGQIVEDVMMKKMQKIYHQDLPPLIKGYEIDKTIFDGKKYLPVDMVQFGRGCCHDCDFCSISAFYKGRLHYRPIKEIVEEIENLGTRHIFFTDDNLFSDYSRTKELLQALIPLNIRWTCQAGMDIAKHPKILDLMKKSGCKVLVTGFESLESKNLFQMNKKSNLEIKDKVDAIKKIQDHGIMIWATFVFGYDYDTIDSFDRSVEFAIESGFFLANFNPLTPTPKTPLYNRLLAQNRLIHGKKGEKWWLDPDYRYGKALFHPAGMTAEELEQGCFRARSQFYNFASVFKRSLDRRIHSYDIRKYMTFWIANLISRKEVMKKQGSRLGGSKS